MRRPGDLRSALASNPSPLTLDGTRTYVVGRERVAVIDPGPNRTEHIEAVASLVGGAAAVVLLTHDHPDHSAGAEALAGRLGADLRSARDGTLRDGDTVPTDAGDLVAVATPGHTPDHIGFHWPAARAAFVGDLLMGGLDTTLVAPPDGDLADYLASLDRVRALGAEILYPTHGPPFTDPDDAITRYVRHRREREAQVRAALEAGARTPDEIVDHVYGTELEPGLRAAAAGAVEAYVAYLSDESGR